MGHLWLVIGVACAMLAVLMPPLDPEWEASQQPILIGLAALCAAIWLRAVFSKRRSAPSEPILIDGSNVMHWQDGKPNIAVVDQLVQALRAKGYRPGVIFDANVGYKLSNRFLGDAAMARLLDLPVKQVMVSPKGTPADEFLLQAARDMDAPIITNDRFRDWQDSFPEVARAGKLIRGGVQNGAPYLKTTP